MILSFANTIFVGKVNVEAVTATKANDKYFLNNIHIPSLFFNT
jgi:hypothetical protein